ncbi:hypothetical protein [Streptomyces nojiriensis]|uniref:Integral-membrane protein n=1 Tax=Streptomyces nojiriensis TaxID=66374 RepID=A0ABQ3SHD7_9ACTN|nr:hypothetical protein [Streptomyces nojiriensis]QTI49166.1 hypothetical protein JYK04_07037 [Streptomyces nojiriensis]GGS10892.1 hypothetical protein GCM10010205_45450 [Streptomyces nojiriensis]GHI67540.1 hypothetical protein Snoj_14580 [Streptomyces nojiriensis]
MNPVRCFRALRAAMFAALCVLLAATGHLLMSGAAVPWWALSVAFPGTAATAWALAGRERGLLAVTTAAVAVQAVLHAGFSLSQSLAGPAAPTGSGQMPSMSSMSSMVRMSQPPAAGMPEAPAHLHHALHGAADAASAVTGAAGGPLPGGVHEAAAMSPVGMLAAHLLAAVMCGLWLAHGERAVFRVVRAVAGRLWTPLRLLLRTAVPAHRRPVRIRRRRRHRAPRRLFLVHAITSRGPPAGTAVL